MNPNETIPIENENDENCLTKFQRQFREAAKELCLMLGKSIESI